MADVLCPSCGTGVEPDWDWCHRCGFDPDGHRPPTTAPAPPPPSPPPAPSPPVPSPPPFSVPVGPVRRSSTPQVLIVAGVALVSIAVLIAVVVVGQSHRGSSSLATASTSSSDSTASTTSVPAWMNGNGSVATVPLEAAPPDAQTVALAHRYLEIVAPANEAEAAYQQACGCPTHPDMNAAIAAIPTLLAVRETELVELGAMSDTAPEPLATHLRGMVAAKQPYLADMRAIIALGPGAPRPALVAAFQAFNADGILGYDQSQAVRHDLGLPPT